MMRAPRGYHPLAALAELTDVDDSGKQQLVSHYGLLGEKHSEVYRLQHFGFSSRPPKGSTSVVVSLGGERSRSVILGGEHDDYRPTGLEEGESKLYDMHGNVIFMAGKTGIPVHVSKGDFDVTVDEDDAVITTKKGKFRVSSKGDAFIASEGKIYLGTKDGSGAVAVMTASGPSSKVFAVV